MYIVFDIGGTHIRVSGSRDGQTLLEPIIKNTPGQFDEGVDLLKSMIKNIAGNEKVSAIGGGIAGILTPLDRSLFYSPNLKNWEGHSLKVALQDFNCDIHVENDAALAALGEATVGAGKNGKIVAYYTVSTGIGGARIVDGRIDKRSIGFEPGKQIINNATLFSVETFVSGHTIEERYGAVPTTIVNVALWEKATEDLAVAAFNTIVHWSPDTFVFGGPIILKQPGINIQGLESTIKNLLTIFPEQPKIVQASLGEKSGLYGALSYLNQSHF